MSTEQEEKNNNSPENNVHQESTQPNIGEVAGNTEMKMNSQINYDINSSQNQNNEYIETELHTMTQTSSTNDEESLDKETNKLDNQIVNEDPILSSNQKLYGNNINDLNPKCLGNFYAYWFVDNNPKILIGKESKFLFY